MSDVDRILASPTGRRAVEAAKRISHSEATIRPAVEAALAVLTSADEKCATCGGTGDDYGYGPTAYVKGPCPDCIDGSNPAKLDTAEQVAREREDARAEAVAAFVERLPERAGDFRVRDWARGLRERERDGR